MRRGSVAGVARAVGRRWGVEPAGAPSVGDRLPLGCGAGARRQVLDAALCGGEAFQALGGASWAFPVAAGPRSPSARAVGELVPAELRLPRSPPCRPRFLLASLLNRPASSGRKGPLPFITSLLRPFLGEALLSSENRSVAWE